LRCSANRCQCIFHTCVAIVSRLPATNEGRRALEELSATAAAATAGSSAAAVPAAAGSNATAAAAAAEEAAGSSGLSAGTVSLLGFADDLVTMLQLQLNQLNSSRLAELAQVSCSPATQHSLSLLLPANASVLGMPSCAALCADASAFIGCWEQIRD
jgi:hypothetical protein